MSPKYDEKPGRGNGNFHPNDDNEPSGQAEGIPGAGRSLCEVMDLPGTPDEDLTRT